MRIDTVALHESLEKGMRDVLASSEVQAEIDKAGMRIAAEACSGYNTVRDPFEYKAQPDRMAKGRVFSTKYTGAYYQQRDKALSKAVHP